MRYLSKNTESDNIIIKYLAIPISEDTFILLDFSYFRSKYPKIHIQIVAWERERKKGICYKKYQRNKIVKLTHKCN